MQKRQTIFLFLLGIILSPSLWSQPDATMRPKKKEDSPVKKIVTRRSTPSLTVNFKANHDFYFTVDDTRYPKVLKNNSREVKLKAGVHRLSFEEADSTGENVENIFRVTDEMIKQGDSLYTVTFKDDFNEIEKSFSDATQKTKNNTLPTDETDPKQQAVINQLLADMILIEGGSFEMGSLAGQRDEVPHKVVVSTFYFSKYEVTQRQWETIMGYNKSGNQGCTDCPVENVNWMEVDAFIKKINKSSNKKLRLPTEAEWEYVANKAMQTELAGVIDGDVLAIKRKNLFNKTTWYNENSMQITHPVGQKQAAVGVFDLLGNVAEWCVDYYRPDYQNDKPNNPRGPVRSERKVIKGGSYKDTEKTLRITFREKEMPSTANKAVGFRLVSEVN